MQVMADSSMPTTLSAGVNMQLNTRGFPSVKIYPLVKRLVSSDVCQKHLQPRINFHNELDWKNNIHNKMGGSD